METVTDFILGGSKISASLVAQTVKRLPTMRETWVPSLGREDLLEKEMATHSSILAWKIPWMEEPGRLQSMGTQRVRHDWVNSLSLKISADGDCSHEIKRYLSLGRKAMTNLDSILKSRDITLPTKVQLVKAVVFPVITYGCESWTIKEVESKEWMLLNCGVGEDSWESLGLQRDSGSKS